MASLCVRVKMCWWLIVRIIRSASRHLISGVRARPITSVDWIWNTALACDPHHDMTLWYAVGLTALSISCHLCCIASTHFQFYSVQSWLRTGNNSATYKKAHPRWHNNLMIIYLICGKCWDNMSDLWEILGWYVWFVGNAGLICLIWGKYGANISDLQEILG
jgi:hypothetical protein